MHGTPIFSMSAFEPVMILDLIINPRRACAARVTVLSLCVCVCVTSLTATPLTYRYKVRYKSQANAVLKVFDSWISLEIFCSKVMALFAYRDDP